MQHRDFVWRLGALPLEVNEVSTQLHHCMALNLINLPREEIGPVDWECAYIWYHVTTHKDTFYTSGQHSIAYILRHRCEYSHFVPPFIHPPLCSHHSTHITVWQRFDRKYTFYTNRILHRKWSSLSREVDMKEPVRASRSPWSDRSYIHISDDCSGQTILTSSDSCQLMHPPDATLTHFQMSVWQDLPCQGR